MRYTRELILTEIEACKRESVRQRLKKDFVIYGTVYGLLTAICLILAYLMSLDINGKGDPVLEGICMAFAISLPIYLVSYMAGIWSQWAEPTPAERKGLGDRIV